MKTYTLILDLDGVLITTPPWKADEMDYDNYSKFNSTYVQNLNTLLTKYTFEIWLSSSRRKTKTIEEFNQIFKNRNLSQSIEGFVPHYPDSKSRKEEIIEFIAQYEIEDYLILDDDKSLNDLPKSIKCNLILTDFFKGFDDEQLKKALQLIAQS